MKEQLFSTLKKSVEILQNHKMTPQELKATEFIKKYPLMYSNEEDKDYWIGELAELIGPEIDLDLLAVENEKKNQRIRELEAFVNYVLNTGKDSGREGCTYGDTDYDSLSAAYGYNTCLEQFQEKAKQLLNQNL